MTCTCMETSLCTRLCTMSTTIRVSEDTKARAAALVPAAGASLGEVVSVALAALEEAEFWRQTREALAAHPEGGQVDPAWDRTLRDGLSRE